VVEAGGLAARTEFRVLRTHANGTSSTGGKEPRTGRIETERATTTVHPATGHATAVHPSTVHAAEGSLAHSIEPGPAPTTLLQAVPITGRTNQIRVHLWNRGLPVLGDPIYLAGRRLGTDPSLEPGGPTMCLHASRIEFWHPLTGDSVAFETPAPPWARA